MSAQSREQLLRTTLWGNRDSVHFFGGTPLPARSLEMFRVIAPMPTTWRLMAKILDIRNPGLGWTAEFRLLTGTGRASFEVVIPVTEGVWINTVVPGLTFTGLFTFPTLPPILATDVVAEAWIAPEVPWDGLRVEISDE